MIPRSTLSPRHHGSRPRFVAILVFFSFVATTVAPFPWALPPALAVVFDAYDIRFQTTAAGDITLASNTLLTCQPSLACRDAQDNGGNYANNQFRMRRIDIDGDGATFTSSSADLTVPATGSVVFAGLYWGAQTNRGSGGQPAPDAAARGEVLLASPAAGYVPITADELFVGGASGAYQGFADVTALVEGAGNGTYTVANVQSATGANRFAGWSLVVVYADPTLPSRNLTVFDGWGEIASGDPVSVTVSGFLTPAFGPVNTTLGIVAYEGDTLYTGDSFIFDGTPLSDAVRPAGNFFNSRLSEFGALVASTDPNYVDQLGFDAALVDGTGLLPNNASSATIDFTTAGDRYFPGVLTTAIEVFVPDLTTMLTKTFVDLNGGDVAPGDVLEFTISTQNIGLDPAIDTVITDPMPAGLTYVAGSLEILDDPDPANIGPHTDANGDDLADFNGGTETVTFRVGTGADAINGGRVVPGETVSVKFAATVDAGTEGSNIVNVASISYVSETLGTPFGGTATPPTTLTPVPRADVELVSKVDDADPVLAGDTVTYDLTVVNNGPSAADDVVVSDTLPAGFTFDPGGSDPGCVDAGGGVVDCAHGTIAAGDSVVVAIAATVGPGVLPSTVTNSASVTTSTFEQAADMANNTIDETTTIVASADVSVTKTDAPDPAVAGETVTYTVTVDNAGPSGAEAVTIVDTIPVGTTVDSITASAGTCTSDAASVTCELGDIAPGASATVDITLVIDPATLDGDKLRNNVVASSATPDPELNNNDATEETDVDRTVSLDLTKSDIADPVVAGRLVTYSLTVTNTGPSDATNVVVTDTLPAGTTFEPSASSATCSPGGSGTVDCDLGDLAVGASSSVAVSAVVDPSTVPGTITNSATATSDEDAAGATATEDTAVERSADLSITKVDSSDPATAGGQVTFTVTVVNEGPSDAANAVVTDTLPVGMTFASSPTCTAVGQVVTCVVGDVPAGGTATAELTVDIDAAIPNGTVLANEIAVTSDDPDPNPSNDSSTELTQIDRVVDLEFTKSASADPVVAGEPLTYTLVVENLGPSVATNVTVSDPLPPDVAFDAVATTAGTCTEAGGTVDCDLGTLAVGAVVTITIDVTVDPATADGTQLMNTASADATELAAPIETSENTSVSRQADLTVAKTGAPDPVLAGEQLTYTVTVTNAGPADAGGTALLDALPAGVTIVSSTPDQGTCVEGPGVVDCDLGTVPAGASVGVTIVVAIPSSFLDGSIVGNTATVFSDEPDPAPGNNTVNIDTTVGRQSDLSVTKTDVTDPVAAGGTVLYTVEVTNNGPSDASNVVVEDDEPVSMQFNQEASSAFCNESGGTVDCDFGIVAAGDTVAAIIAFDVDAGVADGTVITNTAAVLADELDPDASNDAASEDTTIAREADLAVVKVDDPDPVVAGDDVTYTIDVTNNGPSLASAAMLTDTLDANLAFVSATVLTGGTTCGHSGEPSGGTVTCGPVDLPAGATATIEIVATVASGATGTITNSATASSDTLDSVPSNDTGTAQTTVAGFADLAVAKSAAPDPVIAGEQLTYTIIAGNAGPSAAQAPVVSDILPTALQFDSATVITGTGTCAHSGEANGGTVDCVLDPLPPGATVTIEVVTTVDAATTALSVSNSATITAATTDPFLGDNSATVATSVDRQANLGVTKTSTPDPVIAGETLTSTIVVSNAGPSSASNVAVDDDLDAGVSFVSATASNGAMCTHSGEGNGGTVSCPLGDLGTGDTVTVTVTVTVSAATTGTVADTASATSITADPDPSDNSVTSTTTVAGSADLVLTAKTDAFDPAIAGLPLTYQLDLRNDGPSDALGVVISDTLPPELAFDAAASDPSCTASGQDVTCTLGTVAAGATVSVTIGVIVDSAATEATITNVAFVSSATPDPDPSNNMAEEDTLIDRQALLETEKTSAPNPVVAGEDLTYTITITNSGPSLASGTTMGDPLPLGTTFVSASASNGAPCSETSGLVLCDLGDVPAGATVTVTIVVTVSSTVPDGTQLVNAATADAIESPPSSAPTSTDVARQADLGIAKVDLADPVAAGGTITWQITASNDGPSDASSVTVTDTLPPDTTFDVAGSTAGCTESGGVVTCDLGSIATGGSTVVVVSALVDSAVPVGTVLTNAATVASPDSDPDPGNNTASTDTTVEQIADLAVFKGDEFDPVIAGETVTYFLTAENFGPSNVGNIVLTDVLPVGTTFASGTAGCTAGGGPIVTCAIGALAAGDSIDFIIVADVDPSVPEGATIINNASVTGDGIDPDPANNDVAEATEVQSAPDLELVKSSDPETVVAGEQLTYTVTLENVGASTAADVTLADPLPAETTFVSVATSVGSCVGGATVTCDLGDLLPGATVTVTIVVDVDPSLATGDQISNVVSARLGGVVVAGFEELTSVVRRADISIAKSADPNPAIAGSATTFTLSVTNAGPSDASGIAVSDVLPLGVTVTSLDPGCTDLGGIVSCDVGDLAAGATATVDITVETAPDLAAGATLVNSASATANEVDPDAANNATSDDLDIRREADLAIEKVDVADPAIAGELVTYIVTVTNNGPSDASGVTVTDVLPAGTTFDGLASTSACAESGGVITCDLGVVPADDAVAVVISLLVDPSLVVGDTLINTASVDANEPDPNPDNNTDTEETEIDRSAGLSITKTVDPATATAGEELTYTITVTNSGPSFAANVVVTDELPAEVTFVSASPECSEAGGVVTCELGTVENDASREVTITVLVDAAATGTTINTASVASTNDDPDPSDNTSTPVETPIEVVTDLAITKVSDPNPFVPGEPITYTIVISNGGPSRAVGATVTDSLPAALADPTWSCEVTGDGTCGAASGSGDIDTTVDLAPGSSATITVDAVVASQTTGSVTNTATVAAGPGATDPDLGNNSATDTNPTNPAADLAISKTATPDPYVPGAGITYTIEVVNNGPFTAPGNGVVDQLPAGVTGAEWACTITGVGACDPGSGQGDVDLLVDLDAGARATIIVTASTAASFDAPLVNTAIVLASEEITDPNDANNSATTSTPPAANQPPVAVDDFATTNSGDPVVIDVLANDFDPDGLLDPTSVTILTPVVGGSASVYPITGAITVTPDDGFVGELRFTYQVCDLRGACSTAVVVVTVLEDAPLPRTGGIFNPIVLYSILLLAAGFVVTSSERFSRRT